MSSKPVMFCLFFLLAWGGAGILSAAETGEAGDVNASASEPAAAGGHVHNRRPLDRAKGVLQRNEQAQPQSQGLDNANERTAENQARFIEKHQTAAPERVERVERVEKVERPERPERPDMGMGRPEIARTSGAPARPDRPGLGKGR